VRVPLRGQALEGSADPLAWLEVGWSQGFCSVTLLPVPPTWGLKPQGSRARFAFAVESSAG